MNGTPGAPCRVVLDTNQIVGAGSRWLLASVSTPDPNPHRRLLVCVAQKHTGLHCPPIIREYVEKLLERGHPPPRVRKLIAYLVGSFESVTITSSSAPVPPVDPDDESFLLCAIDGAADYLVSEDRDLLRLKNHYQNPLIGRCSELVDVLDTASPPPPNRV